METSFSNRSWLGRGGVLGTSLALKTYFEVLGLEAYKSSKIFCPRLEDSTFFDSLKMSHGHDLFSTSPWKTAETSRKICEELFFWKTPDISRKIGVSSREDPFFFWRAPGNIFWGLFFRTLAPCVLYLEHSCPWPREGLSSKVGPWPRIFLCPWPRRLSPRLQLCGWVHLTSQDPLFVSHCFGFNALISLYKALPQPLPSKFCG